MKTLGVRLSFRGVGMGRELVAAAVAWARGKAYPAMKLDTVPGKMDAAIRLCLHPGFAECEPC